MNWQLAPKHNIQFNNKEACFGLTSYDLKCARATAYKKMMVELR
jgi:hypothetical protein